MAIGTAHGEFPRCVVGVSGSDDAFALIADAFNIAEDFQIPVIVLTDKQLMEALYTQVPFNQEACEPAAWETCHEVIETRQARFQRSVRSVRGGWRVSSVAAWAGGSDILCAGR